MDVAEQEAHAGSIEFDAALGPCLIQPQIKTPSIVKRKNIVKEGILVREFNHGPEPHNQHVGLESLVPLHQLRGIWHPAGNRHSCSYGNKMNEPDRHV